MINSLYPTFRNWSNTGSIWLISDTHFDDPDCKLMDEFWITPEEHMKIIKAYVHKNDTLIHLGDVGNPKYLKDMNCLMVLITGNHDKKSQLQDYFDIIYDGPLFIADRLLLSHEPIYGLSDFCVNIHGHNHERILYPQRNPNKENGRYTHWNIASNVVDFTPLNLGMAIKMGLLASTPNYHRITIDNAGYNHE